MTVYGMSDGKLEDKNIEVLDYDIAIEKEEIEHEQNFGQIIVKRDYGRGFNLVKGKIISIGDKAKLATNLNVGDNVLCDHYGAYADTHPIAVYPSDNIIVKVL